MLSMSLLRHRNTINTKGGGLTYLTCDEGISTFKASANFQPSLIWRGIIACYITLVSCTDFSFCEDHGLKLCSIVHNQCLTLLLKSNTHLETEFIVSPGLTGRFACCPVLIPHEFCVLATPPLPGAVHIQVVS